VLVSSLYHRQYIITILQNETIHLKGYVFLICGKLYIDDPKEGKQMPEGKMSKKLEQAVEYANNTNPSAKTNNKPNTSKSDRERRKK
jgi:hypothetical protein